MFALHRISQNQLCVRVYFPVLASTTFQLWWIQSVICYNIILFSNVECFEVISTWTRIESLHIRSFLSASNQIQIVKSEFRFKFQLLFISSCYRQFIYICIFCLKTHAHLFNCFSFFTMIQQFFSSLTIYFGNSSNCLTQCLMTAKIASLICVMVRSSRGGGTCMNKLRVRSASSDFR